MKKILAAFIFLSLFAGCKKSDNGSTTFVPLPPSDLQGVAISTTQVGLNWTDKSTNESGFKVQRKTGPETFKDIATLNSDVTIYSDNGLTPSTAYTYRVYAYNNAGSSITYTNEVTVTTKTTTALATLTTANASTITQTAALSGGNISSDGGAAVTARGVVWSTSANPTIALTTKTTDGTGNGAFTSNITGLIANTTYYIRAYATNSVGTAYGNELSCTTAPINLPSLTTSSVSSITQTTATSGGNITSDGGAAITARGVVWSTSANPTIALTTKTTDGTSTGTFTSNITGLTANTTYYLRAYATNSVGTAYGNEASFKTIPVPLMDVDGNSYLTVTIGTQVWMAENLRTTKYREGSNIPLVTDQAQWANNYSNNTTLPMMCWYDNDKTTYTNNKMGALYNWYAINPATNGNKNVCPTGWHVPSIDEWKTLATFLGGESVAGGKMKSTGTIQFGDGLWNYPNEGATNSSGFSGLPGGDRRADGGFFYSVGGLGYWWSFTENGIYYAYFYGLDQYSGSLDSGSSNVKTSGYSVRCLKD